MTTTAQRRSNAIALPKEEVGEYYQDFDSLSEEEKLKPANLKTRFNQAIEACRTSATDEIRRAYDLRNGEQSREKFAYLWEAYGLTMPARLRNVHVLKPLFDQLVGQERTQPYNYSITCRDERSLLLIDKQKKNRVVTQQRTMLLQNINDRVTQFNQAPAQPVPGQPPPAPPVDRLGPAGQAELIKNMAAARAELEIWGQDMLEYQLYLQKVRDVLNTMFDDVVTSGRQFYRCRVIQEGLKPVFEAVNPEGFFYSKSPNTKRIKDCMEVVYKEHMTLSEVVSNFELDQDDLKELYKMVSRTGGGVDVVDMQLLMAAGAQDARRRGHDSLNVPLIEVCHVEVKANNKIEYDGEPATENSSDKKPKYKYRQDLYHGVKIGANIFTEMGKYQYTLRHPDEPSKCDLTYDGACYMDRNGKPYSLVLKTEDIGDQINILNYFKESLVAMSGTKAVDVNFADIPNWLGTGKTNMERLMIWIGLLKQGVRLLDFSQDGVAGNGKYANYGSSSLDMTLDASVEQIDKMIERLESIAGKIIGVPPQAIGALSERDGKGVAEIAIRQSSIVTQPLFSLHYSTVREALTMLLNACRVAYPDGLSGSYTKPGTNYNHIFSIPKGDFHLADYDVHLSDDGSEMKAIEKIDALVLEMVKAGMIEAELAIDTAITTSLTDIRQKIAEGTKLAKESENSQLRAQLEQVTQQVQQLTGMLNKLDEQKQQIDSQRVQNETAKTQGDLQLQDAAQQEAARANRKGEELEGRRVDLEVLQQEYPGQAKEVKND